jgi:7-cyano-7-deazaguanine synthase
MDSIAIAWWKRPHHAITIDYGQKAAIAEKTVSAAVCERLGITHHIVTVDCRALGSGDMAGTAADAAAPESDWWPYRNQLLVTLAAMRAIALRAKILFIGTVASDGVHLDGTADFVKLLDNLVSYQEWGLRIQAPAIDLTTPELVSKVGVPAEILLWAHSCHKADLPCGDCRGCNKYNESMEALGYVQRFT